MMHKALEDFGQEIAWEIGSLDEILKHDAFAGRSKSQGTEASNRINRCAAIDHSEYLNKGLFDLLFCQMLSVKAKSVAGSMNSRSVHR